MHLIGIEIGGTKLQLVAGNECGEILERVRFAVDRAAGGGAIRRQIAKALPGLIERWKPVAIGVGYGGPVDWKTGRIKCSHHVKGWDNFPLAKWLTERSGLPAFVENDANTGAFAEALHGAGRGASTVFWINSGTGVGGGFVIDGRIYHGRSPTEMEVGHMRMIDEYAACRPGDTVEASCCGPAIDKMVRDYAEDEPDTPLAKLLPRKHGGEARYIAPALRKRCSSASGVLDEVGNFIGLALAQVVHLLNPEVIVFGGGVSLIGEPLRKRIEKKLNKEIMNAMRPAPPVRLAALGEDSVPVGALALAAQRLAESAH